MLRVGGSYEAPTSVSATHEGDSMSEMAVWLVAGGPMQFHLATKIKERGYRLVISDGSDEAFCRPIADEFLVLDTFDIPGHLTELARLREEFDLKSVITVGADCHDTVNAIRIALALPHYPPEVSQLCRSKSAQRKFLSERKFLQPVAAAFSDFDEASEMISSHPGDFVVKADNNSGSRGFSELAADEDLSLVQFHRAKTESSTGVVVLESLLRPARHAKLPAELSVESMWIDGEFFALNAVDRFFSRDAWLLEKWAGRIIDAGAGIEIGHLNPSMRTNAELSEVFSMLREAGLALGLHQVQGATPLKADIFISEEGPVVLELTPRLSGGWDSSASTIERGADFQTAQLLLSINSSKYREEAINMLKYRADRAPYVFVMAVPPKNAADNIGRDFYLGAGKTPEDAALVASENAELGVSILKLTSQRLKKFLEIE